MEKSAERSEMPIRRERASATETPDTKERAAEVETSAPIERADSADLHGEPERAEHPETPVVGERAVKDETSVHGERADPTESTEQDERADSADTSVYVERADTRPELTVLVLLRDQLQKLRIAEGNRAIASAKLQEDDRADLHLRYETRIQELEDDITNSVKAEMRTHPAWPWLSEIRGVAETSAALVVGYIDIERAPTVSALWRFAGYGVVDGQRERRTKGEKSHYNARLKTMVWRLIDLQVKLRGPYRDIYDNAKHTYMTTRMAPATDTKTPVHEERAVKSATPTPSERADEEQQPAHAERAEKMEEPARVERADGQEPPASIERAGGPESTVPGERAWTLGHCEAAARRKAAKLFLSHLWQVWREAEGLPVGEPFVARAPGHDIIDPWRFVRDHAARRAESVESETT